MYYSLRSPRSPFQPTFEFGSPFEASYTRELPFPPKFCNGDFTELPSLKLTASSHLEMGLNAPKGNEKVCKHHPFSGAKLLVSGSVPFFFWMESIWRRPRPNQ